MANGTYVPRRSLAGPVTLIILGVVFLLRNMGYRFPLFQWFSQYWPLLLILWGLIRIWEHYSARRAGYATPRVGFLGVCLLIFLIIMGISATTAHRVNWHALGEEPDIDEAFANVFGKTLTFDDQMEQDFPAGASLRVISDRGEVVVNSWDQPRIKVVWHKKVTASSESEAQKANSQSRPQITVAGDSVTLNANTSGSGDRYIQTDMQIYVPRKGALDVATRRGDITIRDRQGDLKISNSRGDISVEDLAGNLTVQMRRNSLHGAHISGNVAVEGRLDNVNLSDVTGTVGLNGDFFGSVTLNKIARPVNFKSSRTDLEIAKLDGDFNLDSGDLHVATVTGPVRIVTRSKDIHLEGVSGDLRLENSNGTIEVHAVQPGRIDITNRRGDIEVVLPAESAFQLDAHTLRGDIESDFSGMDVRNERHESRATGHVGSGGPQIRISSEYGDVAIRKAG